MITSRGFSSLEWKRGGRQLMVFLKWNAAWESVCGSTRSSTWSQLLSPGNCRRCCHCLSWDLHCSSLSHSPPTLDFVSNCHLRVEYNKKEKKHYSRVGKSCCHIFGIALRKFRFHFNYLSDCYRVIIISYHHFWAATRSRRSRLAVVSS